MVSLYHEFIIAIKIIFYVKLKGKFISVLNLIKTCHKGVFESGCTDRCFLDNFGHFYPPAPIG
jgi:hypothetical protein